MVYYEQMNARPVPTGPVKLLHLHWPMIVALIAVACVGFVMLYSVAGGSIDPWASAQMIRFGLSFAIMLLIALTPLTFWRSLSIAGYIIILGLLTYVELRGATLGGAQRWIDLGFMNLQPSELMKISLVLILAQYYAWLDPDKISHPLWVAIPLFLTALPAGMVLIQPDLGTALLLILGAGVIMFLAGVSLWYFGTAIALATGLISAVFLSRGTGWQLLRDYQYNRIDVFLDPSLDPLGAGYNISQAKIALGSGGVSGRGLMEGTQSQLNFLPERQTDFIFVTLAEEFGLIGGLVLLGLYTLIILFGIGAALRNTDRFGALMTAGLITTFFFYFAVNMLMVMGLAPVVGVPLPLVSYGGSAMLALMVAFGLIQSAHVHRPRGVRE